MAKHATISIPGQIPVCEPRQRSTVASDSSDARQSIWATSASWFGYYAGRLLHYQRATNANPDQFWSDADTYSTAEGTGPQSDTTEHYAIFSESDDHMSTKEITPPWTRAQGARSTG